MKKSILISTFWAFLMIPLNTHATLIHTGFDTNGGADGIMFDINLLGGDITFDTMQFLTSNLMGIPTDVEIYTRTGTHVGFEENSAGWTLRFSGSLTPEATIDPTLSQVSSGLTNVDFADFVLSGGQTHSFYLVTTDRTNIRYETGGNLNVGDVIASENQVEILAGTGLNHSAGDVFSIPAFQTFTPRLFRGGFNTPIVNSVPAPATLLLFGLGLIGIGWARR